MQVGENAMLLKAYLHLFTSPIKVCNKLASTLLSLKTNVVAECGRRKSEIICLYFGFHLPSIGKEIQTLCLS